MRARARIVLDVAALIALAGGLGWLSARCRGDVRRARERVARGGQIIHTCGGAVEYAEAGQGPALLVIHGAGGGYDQGLVLAGALAYGYRVIAPSRFGYLRTPVPEHPSLALQADAHACLLDALAVRQAAVMGVSAGAPSAIEFALRYPQRCTHLVLLAPAAASRTPAASPGALRRLLFASALRADVIYWAISHLAPFLVQQTVLGTPPAAVAAASESERERVAKLMRDLLPLSERQAGLFLEEQLIEETRTQALEQIGAPTLTVSAEDDGYGTYENAKRIAARVRHGRFIGYRTGGHLLVGHDSEVSEAIDAFLHERTAERDGQRAHSRADTAGTR